MVDENSFVKVEIQNFLSEHNWVLKFSSLNTVPVTKLYPKGLIGMQKWERNNVELYINYEDNGKHSCELYYNDSDLEKFKIRNLRSILKRRKLA
jgi:hypothetical protein